MKAQKKTVVIDCFEIKDVENQFAEIKKWVEGFGDSINNVLDNITFNSTRQFCIKTLEGHSYAIGNDDYIIRGVKGEYYPCKKDIFK